MSKHALKSKAKRVGRAKKFVMAGAVSATAVAVCLTPTLANAASSQTYFIGFPDWLPIGAGSTLPSDPNAISAAIIAAKDRNPLIGWGQTPVDLKPVFVTWIDGVPVYSPPKTGQTGSHTETYTGPNPLYQPAYDTAIGSIACRFSSNKPKCAADIVKAVGISQFVNISVEVPDYGIITPGKWTTPTAGQWVSPTDLSGLPPLALVDYLASGDRGALAPLLNWTAYFTNVNLIAYGDGAIAAGQAYQAVIDSAKNGTYPVGEALTGPRQIAIVDADGKVTLVTVYPTNNPLDYPNPTYPAGGTPPDYVVVQPGGVIDLTVLSLVLVRNPGRANGGLYARFAPIYEELTGVNPVTPERRDVLPAGVDPDLIKNLLTGSTGDISLDDLGNLQAVLESADGKPIIVTLKADFGWQYDLMSDAPATANPIAWANSVASSIFLTNLLTGVDFGNLGEGAHIGEDGTIYYTIPVDDLPLLAPLRLPAQAIGLATGQDINTPVADAIEPFLKILVNTAYTDVQRNEDGTWTRTLDQFDENVLFGTQTLTRDQQVLLAGDLIAALGQGFGDELTDVLTRTATQVSDALDMDLTADQKAALATPGTTIKTVSRDVGDGVSQVLGAVESQLPEGPAAPTQEQLAKPQREVGTQLAAARDQINKTVGRVTTVLGNGRTVIASGSASTVAKASSTPTSHRKTPVKDAVTKAGADLTRAVTNVGNQIKKALTPKDRTNTTSAGEGETS
jgi:hypothetical protein